MEGPFGSDRVGILALSPTRLSFFIPFCAPVTEAPVLLKYEHTVNSLQEDTPRGGGGGEEGKGYMIHVSV